MPHGPIAGDATGSFLIRNLKCDIRPSLRTSCTDAIIRNRFFLEFLCSSAVFLIFNTFSLTSSFIYMAH